MRVRGIVAIAIAALVLAVEIWAVVPAPALPLLAFAVAVPELAPWGVAAAALAIVAVGLLARARSRRIALAIAAVAMLCAAWPLAAVPLAEAASDRAFAAVGIGHDDGTTAYSVARSFVRAPEPLGIRITNGIPFRTRDGFTLRYDLYRPRAPGPHPTVIDVHGGGWLFGSRADEAPIGRALAARGYTVVAPDYRLAPRWRFPTQLADVDDAIASIARARVALDADTARVAIMGRSAGAELALLAAYDPQPLRVRAAIGYYAPVDLTAGYRRLPSFDPANVRSMLRAYVGGTPERYPDRYRAASPIRLVSHALPPTFLIAGDRDQLVRIDFQREFANALRAAGARVVAVELPWSNHAFDQVPGGLGEQIARRDTLRFLGATIGDATLEPR